MPKVLINFAHPAYQRSVANHALIEAVNGMENVTVNDLYHEYPDQMINVEREQELLTNHDIIVFQHPLFWYSSPALLKEWQDLVLTHGWAYGSEGNALQGKAWQQVVTMGGTEDAYQHGGFNRYTMDELLRPFDATAHMCGMKWMDPFTLFAVNSLDADALKAEAQRYREHILALSSS